MSLGTYDSMFACPLSTQFCTNKLLVRSLAGETIMSVAYGLEIKPKDDPYIQTAERGVHPLVAAAVPGAFLVDMLPILKYVPEWIPGAGFQKKAREWGKLAMTMVDMPFDAAKKLIVRLLSRYNCWQKEEIYQY